MDRKNYFTGWYYKQEKGGSAIAFIPAFHISDGVPCASIQAITDRETYSFSFPENEVRMNEKRDIIRIGNNIFTPDGIRVSLSGMRDGKTVTIRGRLKYTDRVPLRYDIMGPFSLVPYMQCRHGVVSMTHGAEGAVTVDGMKTDFSGGRGYIEKDRGSSFPSWYFWCQCGWQEEGPCSVMASVADIPFGLTHFKGCIAAIYYNGRQYRLATYLGVKVLRFTKKEILLKQGSLCLHLMTDGAGLSLRAPRRGNMERIIKENLSCRVRARFYVDDKKIFDHTGTGSAEAEF